MSIIPFDDYSDLDEAKEVAQAKAKSDQAAFRDYIKDQDELIHWGVAKTIVTRVFPRLCAWRCVFGCNCTEQVIGYIYLGDRDEPATIVHVCVRCMSKHGFILDRLMPELDREGYASTTFWVRKHTQVKSARKVAPAEAQVQI